MIGNLDELRYEGGYPTARIVLLGLAMDTAYQFIEFDAAPIGLARVAAEGSSASATATRHRLRPSAGSIGLRLQGARRPRIESNEVLEPGCLNTIRNLCQH